jgi:hypothetical protein
MSPLKVCRCRVADATATRHRRDILFIHHKAPKFEIIKSIETAAVRLAPEKAEAYRAKINLQLKNVCNLT